MTWIGYVCCSASILNKPPIVVRLTRSHRITAVYFSGFNAVHPSEGTSVASLLPVMVPFATGSASTFVWPVASMKALFVTPHMLLGMIADKLSACCCQSPALELVSCPIGPRSVMNRDGKIGRPAGSVEPKNPTPPTPTLAH